jgi:tetratricopeptide (TPR) repeat protein
MVIRLDYFSGRQMNVIFFQYPACVARRICVSVVKVMTLQEQYDDAMFDFSRGGFEPAIAKLQAVLVQDPANFDAQLALGMAFYRSGDLPAAIAEGHKAEKLRPKEQLVHTNLSLFYMKSGDKVTAEHHGLQARIAGWREDAAKAKEPGEKAAAVDPELEIAGNKPQPVKLPTKFPDQPWKKKKVDGQTGESGTTESGGVPLVKQ